MSEPRQSDDPVAYLLAVEKGEIELHPSGGWPEFTLTLRFYVISDDEAAVERVQRETFERDWGVVDPRWSMIRSGASREQPS